MQPVDPGITSKYISTAAVLNMFFQEFALGRAVPKDDAGNPVLPSSLFAELFTFENDDFTVGQIACDAANRIIINANGIGQRYFATGVSAVRWPAIADQLERALKRSADIELRGIVAPCDFRALNALILKK